MFFILTNQYTYYGGKCDTNPHGKYSYQEKDTVGYARRCQFMVAELANHQAVKKAGEDHSQLPNDNGQTDLYDMF